MSISAITRRVFVPTAVALTLLIAASAPPARAEGNAATPLKPTVNINQATSAELARLPRVGGKLADRIVTHRTQHGPFKRVEDLMEVKGVGEKMFTHLKPYLSTTGSTTLAAKVSSASRSSKSAGKGGGKSPARSGKRSKGAASPSAPGR